MSNISQYNMFRLIYRQIYLGPANSPHDTQQFSTYIGSSCNTMPYPLDFSSALLVFRDANVSTLL